MGKNIQQHIDPQELVRRSPLLNEAALETAKRYLVEARRRDYDTQDVPKDVMALVIHHFAYELLYRLEDSPAEFAQQFQTQFEISLDTVRDSIKAKLVHYRVVECTLDAAGKWEPGNPINEEVYLKEQDAHAVADLWNRDNEMPEVAKYVVLQFAPQGQGQEF